MRAPRWAPIDRVAGVAAIAATVSLAASAQAAPAKPTPAPFPVTDIARLYASDISSYPGGVYLQPVETFTALRRDRIGFIFQAFNLIPTLTAEENILLPLAIAGRKPDREWFDLVIETVGLRNRLGHRPNELSGGQQQRVACARALVSRPEIIFADEPTGNLDSRSGAEVLDFLQRSVEEFGQTIVMVTHDPMAASHTHRAVFLADGQIRDDLADPTADSVLDRMRSLDTRAA